MSFIEQHMIDALKDHELILIASQPKVADPERYPRWKELRIYRMGRPDVVFYCVYITFSPMGINLGGDIIFTENGRGITSCSGYGLDWFSGQLGERYLCEKFFGNSREWNLANCLNTIREWARGSYYEEQGNHYKEKELQKLLEEIESQGLANYDSPAFIQERLYWIDPDLISEGLPGYDYPRVGAGWLCAVQKRFAELFQEGRHNLYRGF